MDVTIAGTAVTATIAGTTITTTVSETVTSVTVASNGPQGAPGAAGVVAVVSPITNTGTIGSATIGIDQTLLSVTPSQVVGTAVTLTSGTIQKTQVAGTAVTLADTGTVSNAMLANSSVTFNGQTVALGGTATITIATADYATLAGTATYATNAGSALTAGTSSYATLSGTATFASTSGTASYSTTSGTAVFSSTSGTATYATNAGTAVNISGTIAPSQVTGTAAVLGANTFTGKQTFPQATASSASINIPIVPFGSSVPSSPAAGDLWSYLSKLYFRGSSATYSVLFGELSNTFSDIQYFNPATGSAFAVTTAASSDAFYVNTPTVSQVMRVTANGGVVVNPPASVAVSLILKGAAGNTSNLQEWQTSAATVATVSSSGAFTISPSSGTALTVNAASSAIGLVVKYSGTGTSDLLQVQNSSGTVLAKVTSDGRLGVNTTGTGYLDIGDATISKGPGAGFSFTSGITNIAYLGINASGAQSSPLNIAMPSATSKTVIAGAASQTGNLLQYQDSSTNILGGRNALAQLWSGSTAPVTVATGGATTAASGTGTTATITTTNAHGLAVGDLVTVASVTPTGYNATAIVTAVTSTTFSYANTTTGSQTVAGTVSVPAQASITARSAGTVPLVVRAAASQTAALTRWLASDGSTINAQVTSTGGIAGVSVQTNNNFARIGEANSGGFAQLYKATASAVPGATDYARLFIVAGTNAGTLKLVIRAGTAGAETTILDNIPQT